MIYESINRQELEEAFEISDEETKEIVLSIIFKFHHKFTISKFTRSIYRLNKPLQNLC